MGHPLLGARSIGAQRQAGNGAGCPRATLLWSWARAWQQRLQSSGPGLGLLAQRRWLPVLVHTARSAPSRGDAKLGNRGQRQHSPNGRRALRAVCGPKCSHPARGGPTCAARVPPLRPSHPARLLGPARLRGQGLGLAMLLQNPLRGHPVDLASAAWLRHGAKRAWCHVGSPWRDLEGMVGSQTRLSRPAPFGGEQQAWATVREWELPMVGALRPPQWVLGALWVFLCPLPACQGGRGPPSPTDVPSGSHSG